MRTFALYAETKGNPAVSKKKKPSEDNATLEDQAVNGETVDDEAEVDPLAEGEGDETETLDEATGGEPFGAEGEEELPLDEMAAEEGEEPELGPDGMPLEEGLDGEEGLAEEAGVDPNDPSMDPNGAPVANWAGDVVLEQNEVTDPAQSFRSFTGVQGEQAWLDRADDGTLTGWVRDADGTTYRYADADAWAIDVDDAQMVAGDAVDPMAEDPMADPMAEDPMAEEELGGDPLAEDPLAEEEPLEEEPVDEELPAEESGAPIDAGADPAAAPEAPEDEDPKKKKAPFQGKTLLAVRRLN